MKELSVKNIRDAVLAIEDKDRNFVRLQQISNEELCNCDFHNDLQMEDGQIERLISKLNCVHNLRLPHEIRKLTTDNTVRSFIDTVNLYIKELNATDHFVPQSI